MSCPPYLSVVSICPLTPVIPTAETETVCGGESDMLYVVSGYVFLACTFYASSYAFTVKHSVWGEENLFPTVRRKEQSSVEKNKKMDI